MMGIIRLADGTYPPFGAEVINGDGVSVSMIMEGASGMAGGGESSGAAKRSVEREKAVPDCHPADHRASFDSRAIAV